MRSCGILETSLTCVLLAVQASSSILSPPVLPLVVRNPYLNVHLSDARSNPWSQWPIFWTGQHVGLSLMARLPQSCTVYPLLGRPHDTLLSGDDATSFNISFPRYLGAQFDASTTNFSYALPIQSSSSSNDEVVKLTVSFNSPITPTSTLRQSIPASYVEITGQGRSDVEIYMDLNGMWVTGSEDSIVEWKLTKISSRVSSGLWSWLVYKKDQLKFSEERDRSEYGHMRFTSFIKGSYEAGAAPNLRRRFAATGSLRNITDSNFRSVSEDEPVFAFSKTLKLSTQPRKASGSPRSAGVLFTIAHIRDELVQYASASGLMNMKPLWSSSFACDDTLIAYHFLDFKYAVALSSRYSCQLTYDALASGGAEYADIVALSARQVLGATDFSGTLENPLIFLKEISSNGNCQTIDVIFPTAPFFLYTNPTWLAYLLEPLLEHMLNGQYPNKYAMHDLGSHYPNLTGHPLGRDEYMPLEECGNMLIMATALVNAFGDQGSLYKSDDAFHESVQDPVMDVSTLSARDDRYQSMIPVMDRSPDSEFQRMSAKTWLERSYDLFEQWTEYLVEFALMPENQLSTDDFAGWLPLQTNLALKGIIGIKAMSELAKMMGYDDRTAYYQNISDTYIAHWLELGLSRDSSHAKLAYDWYGSWTTLYSLFSDALLCFHTGPPSSPPPLDPLETVMESLHEQLRTADSVATESNNFVPHTVYANQSSWYALSMQKYGLPLDSRHLYTKSDWEFQVAAVASPFVRETIIHKVAKWLNNTSTNRPFTDWYDTEGTGGFGGGEFDAIFAARPVVGSHFSLLVLKKVCGGKAMEGLQHWNDEYHGKGESLLTGP